MNTASMSRQAIGAYHISEINAEQNSGSDESNGLGHCEQTPATPLAPFFATLNRKI